MLEKHFNPAEAEPRIYEQWLASGAFRCGQRPKAESYCIVIPPPNVTGSLHMGHALNNTIQDILCRFERMRGKDVLWQPGMDHAGIATQMVVERQLMEQQEPTRWEMGREKFVERVWEWKEVSGGTITGQLHRLGASCDWDRERFTMDEGLSAAVLKVFVQLYKEGLIYKDKRLVNWDPKLLTAISDLEVQQVETDGQLWHLRYPLEDGNGKYIAVATTRPETMLGDMCVAVHPDDERYNAYIGKMVRLPVVGRLVPVIADEHADPELGTGAVKITPAHDFNDFEVWQRLCKTNPELRETELINIFDQHASIVDVKDAADDSDAATIAALEAIPAELRGQDRSFARRHVVEMFEEAGLLDKVVDHAHTLPYGDRSNVVIEPWLTPQWYVDAKTLAQPAIAAVVNGETVFVPRNWEKTYYEWMHNIQPWCISRQLWWGHQIPVWYGPDGESFVEESEDLALAAAERHYGSRVALTRDEDVLDTWFSSALWPFSTLGWPEETAELKRYYKTDVLVTGFDIIFFWVARMMMMGLHFMKDEEGRPEVPFHTVYIHALVRDEHGKKMSKAIGNIIDPLELIDEFGADAVRFTLAAMAAQGRDIKLATSRVEGYRNFGTKLWNAARFCEMNGCSRVPDFDPVAARVTLNRWIAGEAARTRDTVTKAIDEHRYNDAATALYSFIWRVFCDWYVELAKPVFGGDDEAAKTETRHAAAWALDQILLLLHPFMPFITQELWEKTGGEGSIMAAAWPSYSGLGDAGADAELDWLIRFVSEVRSVRAEMNVPAGAKVPCVITGANAETRRRAAQWETEMARLARLESIGFADEVPANAAQIVLEEATIALPLAGVIDLAAESARLDKEREKIAKDVAQIEGRLGNENFVNKAPEHVIAEAKERRQELLARGAKVDEAMQRLRAAAGG